MSDIREIYEAMKEHSKQKKESNKRFSTNELESRDIKFESKNDGYHLIVNHFNKIADFWPYTGKFIIRNNNKKGRGVFNLIKWMEK